MNVNMSVDSIRGAAAAGGGGEREVVFYNRAAEDSSLHIEDLQSTLTVNICTTFGYRVSCFLSCFFIYHAL